MEKNTENDLNEVVNRINEISISNSSDTDSSEDEYGICEECGNENTNEDWCLKCNSQHFQQNFGNWKSGNKDVDEIIQESQSNCTGTLSFIEWIPYSKFEDIKYIDKGGFGKIYSAIWKEGPIKKWNIQQKQWERSDNEEVALKSLNNSQNITAEFLNEFKNHLTCNESLAVQYFGITQDLETKNYMFVMPFFKGGNLRNFLKSNFSKLSWLDKLENLFVISCGLYSMHNDINLIHRDLHTGNILSFDHESSFITDLGLSKPADEISKDGEQKVFGVIPYIAPEVLSGDGNYSKASDIYSFAMIMFEILTGIPPFYNIPHDRDLALKIYLHTGNILSFDHESSFITDLGLSKPADEISKDGEQKVFGVIPYIAPEVLSGDGNYSKASDIYSFAMIMFEILTGIPPFYNIPHDRDLALKICNGYRPEIPSNIAIPQLMVDMMKRCWDAKPEQRPTAKELVIDFDNYTDNIRYWVKESEIWKQIEECGGLNLTNQADNNNANSSTSYEIHPSAIYTSRCFNFKNLPKPKNLNENENKNTNELTTKDYQITTEE
ncbi:hypothetical protein Glove_162g65 [Diversispora epigaea]|uniref:Protein kinase domain-containing protein n=1 Tax=Diversispora epigaea TaxID=1348612 RepID=A0A397IVZ8_9GLOM|nr:hypothetical protein Glove_162g65 [Diversispora epigaea]